MKSVRATSTTAAAKRTAKGLEEQITDDPTDVVVQALFRLRALLDDADGFTSCHSFLGSPAGKTPEDRWRRVQFSPELAGHFRANIIRRMVQSLPNEDSLIPFTYEEPTASQVAVLAKEDFPGLADWLDEVPEPDWRITFDGDEKFLDKVKVHVAVLAGIDQPSRLTVFRRRSASTLIKRQGILGSFSASKHEFDIVRRQIFDFPTDAEFFEWEGFVYVLNINALEALTDIREITNTQAKKAIASIKSIKGLVVNGLDAVEASLALRPRLSKRLAAAGRYNTFDSIKLNTLAAHIDEYGLPLTAEMKNGKLVISFDADNRVHIEEFVNLVADVYLRSASTGLDYKAHSKEPYRRKSK